MVQISTDYVFAGDADSPYAADARLPVLVSAYGGPRSRARVANGPSARSRGSSGRVALRCRRPDRLPQGDEAPGRGPRLTHRGQRPGRPADVDPTSPRPSCASSTRGALRRLHGTGSGQCSWFDFARATFEELPTRPERVQPITSAEYAAMYPAAARLRHTSSFPTTKWAAARIAPCPTGVTALRRAAPDGPGRLRRRPGISPFLDPVRRRRVCKRSRTPVRRNRMGNVGGVDACSLPMPPASPPTIHCPAWRLGDRRTVHARGVGDGRCPGRRPQPSRCLGRCVGSACLPTGCR